MAASFTDPNDPRGRSVAVANIDAPDGAARALQRKLQAQGYGNVWIADLTRGSAPATLIVGQTGVALATVQQDLGYGQTQVAGGAQGADVTVLLGHDTPAP